MFWEFFWRHRRAFVVGVVLIVLVGFLYFVLPQISGLSSALLIVGVGLRTGVLPGRAPWTLTVVPAAVAAGAIVLLLVLRAMPAGVEQRIRTGRSLWSRTLHLGSRLGTVPRMLREATGVISELLRERQVGVLGAALYWGFDIGALWAALHAFGNPPPGAAVVMAYFIGQLANALPIPGGIGGVEGGMIGALLAFGAPGGVAVLGVLAYRLISFWLPTLPGTVAYVRLRRTVERWRTLRATSEQTAHPSPLTATVTQSDRE